MADSSVSRAVGASGPQREAAKRPAVPEGGGDSRESAEQAPELASGGARQIAAWRHAQLSQRHVLDLQPVIGNQAVGRLLQRARAGGQAAAPRVAAGDRPGLVSTADLAARLQQAHAERLARITSHGHIHFRLPTAADVRALLTSGNVSELVVKDRIATALTRMRREDPSLLKTTDPIPDVIRRVFPSPGVFDEAEYARVADLTDRSKVYENAAEAETKVVGKDVDTLKKTFASARSYILKASANEVQLKQVFGSKYDAARTVYGKADKALGDLLLDMDKNISTDYNLEDPQVGLGGWANPSQQKVHFTASVVKATDQTKSTATVIHEGCHLADTNVIDRGYYGSPAFDKRTEEDKVGNAAHYEEIPRREMGTSIFPKDHEFKPATSSAPLTFEEEVQHAASEYLRMAWDAANTQHEFLRRTMLAVQGGNPAEFANNRARILKISWLMGLTIHRQKAAKQEITPVDLTLSEGIARGTVLIKKEAAKQKVPTPHYASKLYYRNKIIDDSIKAANQLRGDFVKDKILMNWLKRQY